MRDITLATMTAGLGRSFVSYSERSGGTAMGCVKVIDQEVSERFAPTTRIALRGGLLTIPMHFSIFSPPFASLYLQRERSGHGER